MAKREPAQPSDTEPVASGAPTPEEHDELCAKYAPYSWPETPRGDDLRIMREWLLSDPARLVGRGDVVQSAARCSIAGQLEIIRIARIATSGRKRNRGLRRGGKLTSQPVAKIVLSFDDERRGLHAGREFAEHASKYCRCEGRPNAPLHKTIMSALHREFSVGQNPTPEEEARGVDRVLSAARRQELEKIARKKSLLAE